MSNKGNNKIKLKIKIAMIFLLFIAVFFYFEASINSAITQIAINKSSVVATNIIEEAIYTQLKNENSTYEDLVAIEYDKQNEVVALQVNTIAINQVRNDISKSILDSLVNMQAQKISVPLSSILGNNYFLGNLTIINFTIRPMGYLDTKIISNFEESGINQTLHTITIKINMTTECIFPFYKMENSIENEYILAQTIIVGDVPNNYTQVISEDKDVISNLNDYGTSSATD